MIGQPVEPGAMLEELKQVPPAARAVLLRGRAADRVGPLLIALGDEAEKMIVAGVAQAIDSAMLVTQVADELAIPEAQARARRAAGQALAYAGRFSEALEQCGEAIEIAERAGETVQAARARLASIHALCELGRYDDAINAGEQAHAMLWRAGQPALAARADLNLGVIHRKRDDPARAIHHFDRARPALTDEPNILAQLESNRGEALLQLDDLDGAETAFLAARSYFERVGYSFGAAIVEGNLADLAARRGRLDRALHHFESARRHVEHDASRTHLARLLVEQADARAALGMIDDAATDYEQALAVLVEHRQPLEAARARAGLAQAWLRAGRVRDARRAIAEAKSDYESLGADAALARLRLLSIEASLGEASATDLAREAELALAALVDRPLDSAKARYHVARLALARGDVTRAVNELDLATGTARRLGVTPLLADLLHLRGECAMATGDVRSAATVFGEAIALLERVRGTLQADRFRAAFLGHRLAVYESHVAALLELGDDDSIAKAFHAAERARSRSLLDLVRGVVDPSVFSSRDGHETDPTLARELAETQERLNNLYSRMGDGGGALAGGGGNEGSARSLAIRTRELEDHLESLESRLAATRSMATMYAAPPPVASVAAMLAPHEAMMAYFAVGDEVLAFVVRRDGVRLARHLCSTASLAELARRFHFQIGRALRPGATEGARGDRLVHDMQRAAQALHDAVLRPVRALLEDASRWIIVPHGPLHGIPFAALWDGDAWLRDVAELVTSPSAAIALHLHENACTEARAGGAASKRERHGLVIGVADDHAPHVLDEAARVASIIAPTHVLLGHEATVERVSAAAGEAGFIHFAGHGRFDAHNPLASGLRLADRWLTVRDAFRLSLGGAFLTLSGCETGVTEVESGDELNGLIRAFLAAGARGLAVSLWAAHDASTVALMGALYAELREMWNRTPSELVDEGNDRGRGGSFRTLAQHTLSGSPVASCGDGASTPASTPGEALRKAQRRIALVNAHPALWGAFVHIGR